MLTIYPGEPTYSAWGHSAIRLMDPKSGLDAVFNYGTFDMTIPYFIPRFAYGDMKYQLSVDPTSVLLRESDSLRRDVIEQRLRLSPEQIHRIYDLLLENLRPENRTYQYDFVFDNCSTRLLDLLFAVDAVRLPTEDPFEASFRDMIDVYIHDRALIDLGIDLVLGSKLDREPSVRERSFLPVYLMDLLEASTTPEGEPLVLQTRTLLSFDDHHSGGTFPWTLWITSLFALVAVVLSFTGKISATFDRWFLGISGFAGLFMLIMWFATLHELTAMNLNIAWALPTHLAVAIWWKRLPWLRLYARIAAWWTLAVLILQVVSPQAIPLAMFPVVVLLALRFRLIDSDRE